MIISNLEAKAEEGHVPHLLDLDVDGCNLVLECALLVGLLPPLLALQRILVAHLPRNAVLVGQVLGRDAHGRGRRHHVRQRGSERVDELEVDAVPSAAEADAVEGVGRHRHGLGAAGEDDVGVADADLLHGIDEALEARAAEPVDGQRRRRDGQAGLVADVPGEVGGRVVRRMHVAVDGRIDLGRRRQDSKCRLGRVATERRGRDGSELAAVGAKRRALRRDDKRVGQCSDGGVHPFSLCFGVVTAR